MGSRCCCPLEHPHLPGINGELVVLPAMAVACYWVGMKVISPVAICRVRRLPETRDEVLDDFGRETDAAVPMYKGFP